MSQIDDSMIGLSSEELDVLRVNNAPVSYALAVAIGWNEDNENAHDLDAHDPDVQIVGSMDKPHLGAPTAQVWVDNAWKDFDFTDPATLMPIVERFDVRPVAIRLAKSNELAGWSAQVGSHAITHSCVPTDFFGKKNLLINQDKSRALACAMAVIIAHKLGLIDGKGVVQ